jgi:hypothetical protein
MITDNEMVAELTSRIAALMELQDELTADGEDAEAARLEGEMDLLCELREELID